MVVNWDFSREKGLFYQQRAKMVVANLQKRKINAQYVSNRQEALIAVLDMIPEGVTVVRGDSITLEQVGILEELKKRNKNRLLNPYDTKPDGSYLHEKEERHKMHREAFSSDVYLTSTNAVTLDGRLVNIDGFGNRVAAMIFGPKKVIMVTGVNKIVKDVDEALARIHGFAAPVNALRHSVKHGWADFGDVPCARTGKCMDCTHDFKICNFTVIIEGLQIAQKGRINVVLIGEELGI